jgi:hypothetical protein
MRPTFRPGAFPVSHFHLNPFSFSRHLASVGEKQVVFKVVKVMEFEIVFLVCFKMSDIFEGSLPGQSEMRQLPYSEDNIVLLFTVIKSVDTENVPFAAKRDARTAAKK